MDELTVRQHLVLRAIMAAVLANGRPPTVRELLRALNRTSSNGVHQMLRVLIDKGYIKTDPRQARALIVVKDGEGYNVKLEYVRC